MLFQSSISILTQLLSRFIAYVQFSIYLVELNWQMQVWAAYWVKIFHLVISFSPIAESEIIPYFQMPWSLNATAEWYPLPLAKTIIQIVEWQQTCRML